MIGGFSHPTDVNFIEALLGITLLTKNSAAWSLVDQDRNEGAPIMEKKKVIKMLQ